MTSLRKPSVRTGVQAVALVSALALGCRAPAPVAMPPDLSEPAIQQRILPANHTEPMPESPQAAKPLEILPPPRAAEVAEPPAPEPDAPLSLGDAIAFALQNNPRLRVYREQIASARAGEDIAFAPFLPQFDFAYHFSAYSKPWASRASKPWMC